MLAKVRRPLQRARPLPQILPAAVPQEVPSVLYQFLTGVVLTGVPLLAAAWMAAVQLLAAPFLVAILVVVPSRLAQCLGAAFLVGALVRVVPSRQAAASRLEEEAGRPRVHAFLGAIQAAATFLGGALVAPSALAPPPLLLLLPLVPLAQSSLLLAAQPLFLQPLPLLPLPAWQQQPTLA